MADSVDPNALTTDQLWDLIVAAARAYSWRKYRSVATGLSLLLPGLGDHREPFPLPDPPAVPGGPSARQTS